MKFLILLVISVVASSVVALKKGEGTVAKSLRVPYHVAIRLYLPFGEFNQWCGGSLISNRYILIAASCTDDITSAEVHLGANNIRDANEVGHLVINISKKNIIVHEKWVPYGSDHDIALIKLPIAITLNEYIRPARLPKKFDKYNTYAGNKVFISGWRLTSEPAEYVTDKLHMIKVPVLNNRDCGTFYYKDVRNNNICVSVPEDKSICDVDSGAPLVLSDGSMTLVGILSYGNCVQGSPGIFTRISAYLDWIENNSGIKY